MSKPWKNFVYLLVVFAWLLAACGAQESAVLEPTPAATLASTVAAALEETPTPPVTETVQPTATEVEAGPTGTASPVPTNTVAPEPTEEPLPTPAAAAVAGDLVEAEAHRDAVRIVSSAGQEQDLVAPEQTLLQVGEGLSVDEAGRAVLRFSDLLAVEVLRDGGLIVQELDVSEQSAFVTVLQTGGTLLSDFDPQEEIERRLTVQTEFAVITATGTRFLVVREANTPLEWVLGLDAGQDDLEVQALGDPEPDDPTIKPVTTDLARWIAPVDVPSAGIAADMEGVESWLENVQNGLPVEEFGEIVWPHADIVIDTGGLDELPPVGEAFQMGEVTLFLDPEGPYGSAKYALEDCNDDGVQDLAIQQGRLVFDFRTVLARVRALDVTVFNRAEPGTGALRVFNPGVDEIGDELLLAAPGETSTLSLRSDQPYHYADLTVTDACFLGFSLTPPGEDGQPGAPRPVVEDGQAVEPLTRADSAQITYIALEADRYIVDFETYGFEPQLPGRHVHFFFDTVPPGEAGMPGSGPWILYGGTSPFTEYGQADRPDGATQMCVLVANPGHSVQPDSGNCFDLP